MVFKSNINVQRTQRQIREGLDGKGQSLSTKNLDFLKGPPAKGIIQSTGDHFSYGEKVREICGGSQGVGV